MDIKDIYDCIEDAIINGSLGFILYEGYETYECSPVMTAMLPREPQKEKKIFVYLEKKPIDK